MHLTTKSVNSQVTTQLTDLNAPELFSFGTMNLCLDQAERKQPNSHKHMKMTHSTPMAVLQDFSFSFPFLSFEKEFSLREISTWNHSSQYIHMCSYNGATVGLYKVRL